MENLKRYLNNAKDYLDGDGVERFLEYYQLHEKEVEAIWRDMISSFENYSEFGELVGRYGLYIMIDNGCSWKSVPIFAGVKNEKKETEFVLRIFNFNDHNVGVLKCTNLPNTV